MDYRMNLVLYLYATQMKNQKFNSLLHKYNEKYLKNKV